MASSVAPAFRVLVVEDEFLIAMEVGAILKNEGFEVIDPVSTVPAALHRLQSKRPDAAVLDVSLRGERVTPVAQVLLAMKVPFVLASAYLPTDLVAEPALASARNLGKPTSQSALVGAMREFRELASR
jgi:DNA-binding response OmpR family regulator